MGWEHAGVRGVRGFAPHREVRTLAPASRLPAVGVGAAGERRATEGRRARPRRGGLPPRRGLALLRRARRLPRRQGPQGLRRGPGSGQRAAPRALRGPRATSMGLREAAAMGGGGPRSAVRPAGPSQVRDRNSRAPRRGAGASLPVVEGGRGRPRPGIGTPGCARHRSLGRERRRRPGATPVSRGYPAHRTLGAEADWRRATDLRRRTPASSPPGLGRWGPPGASVDLPDPGSLGRATALRSPPGRGTGRAHRRQGASRDPDRSRPLHHPREPHARGAAGRRPVVGRSGPGCHGRPAPRSPPPVDRRGAAAERTARGGRKHPCPPRGAAVGQPLRRVVGRGGARRAIPRRRAGALQLHPVRARRRRPRTIPAGAGGAPCRRGAEADRRLGPTDPLHQRARRHPFRGREEESGNGVHRARGHREADLPIRRRRVRPRARGDRRSCGDVRRGTRQTARDPQDQDLSRSRGPRGDPGGGWSPAARSSPIAGRRGRFLRADRHHQGGAAMGCRRERTLRVCGSGRRGDPRHPPRQVPLVRAKARAPGE
jgi:hypothetical protein